MKILLCEDDLNIAVIAKLSLEQIGKHEVIHAQDGEQSLHMAREGKYDVILLDEMMPKMSGVEVCRTLSKTDNFKTPVIFMSANPQQSRVTEFPNVAIGFIPKPFDPMKLSGELDKIMQTRNNKVAS